MENESMRLSDIIQQQILSPRTKDEIVRSPQLAERKLQHLIDVEDQKLQIKKEMVENDLENTWKSCCISCDKRGIVYFTQTLTLVLIIVFCLIKLSTSDDDDDKVVYVGLLNMVIGILIPSPQLKRNDK